MRPFRIRAGQVARIVPVMALAALALGTPVRAAQDTAAPHPVHIHSGACDQLGDVVVPLHDIAAPEGTASGPAPSHPAMVSEPNRVDLPLQEIIDAGHAINVHLSADQIDTYIACGNIGGILSDQEDGNGKELYVPLQELNDSGYVGFAWLGEDGDATNVGIVLFELDGPNGAAAAEEQLASTANGQPVEIKNFAFNPPTIEVPVGGSITWTNNDNVPHTTTALDRAVLQSGAIPSGTSFTQTFATAGSYDYFCEFHPNMKGTIVVK